MRLLILLSLISFRAHAQQMGDMSQGVGDTPTFSAVTITDAGCTAGETTFSVAGSTFVVKCSGDVNVGDKLNIDGTMSLGDESAQSSIALKLIKTLTGATVRGQHIDFTQLGNDGGASTAFNAISRSSGAGINYDHIVGVQSTAISGSTGTIDVVYGGVFAVQVTSGSANWARGIQANSITGDGNVDVVAGVYIGTQAVVGATNYGLYSAGSAPSAFGGGIIPYDGTTIKLTGITVATASWVGTSVLDSDLSGFGATQKFLSISDNSANYNTVAVGNGTTATAGATHVYARTRSAEGDANTAVSNLDTIASLRFYGADGTTYRQAAQIKVYVDGTPGASDMPGTMDIQTTPDGSATPVTRLTIDSMGPIGVNDATPDASLDILSFAAPTGYALSVSSQSDVVGSMFGVMGDGTVQLGSGATRSTFTATGFWEPLSQTKAQIDVLTPTKVGQVIDCTDCTLPGLCRSTGTAVAQWRKVESATLGCGSGN